MNQMQDVVKTYYGETLTSSSDLKTDACTTESRPAAHVSAALAAVHDDVAAKYYGCGLAIPAAGPDATCSPWPSWLARPATSPGST